MKNQETNPSFSIRSTNIKTDTIKSRYPGFPFKNFLKGSIYFLTFFELQSLTLHISAFNIWGRTLWSSLAITSLSFMPEPLSKVLSVLIVSLFHENFLFSCFSFNSHFYNFLSLTFELCFKGLYIPIIINTLS